MALRIVSATKKLLKKQKQFLTTCMLFDGK